jgi:hypothetical protein
MRGIAAALRMAAHEGPMRKLAIVVLILVAIPIVWFWVSFPTVSYRYRLTIAVEVDGQVHTGSSVIEVSYRFNPQFLWPTYGMYSLSVKGQAVVVGLGARGVLVAALGDNSDPNTVSAAFLAARALQPSAQQSHGWYAATLDAVRSLARMQDAVPLAANNMPPFIWFSDPADPVTGRLVKPNDFASVIGDAARLSSAQVQITHDPIVIDIDKKLPLYNALPPPPVIVLPGKFPVNWSMFIAPGSIR